MMVRFSLTVMLLLLPCCLAHGQPRHVRGMDMLGLNAGLGSSTLSIGFSFQRYFTGNLAGKIYGNVDQVNYPLSTYHAFYVSPKIQYSLLTNNRNLYINAQCGLNGGLEHLRSNIFNQDIHNLYIGESIGLGIECFLSSLLKVELEIEQRYFQASKISNYRYIFILGTYFKL